MKVTVDHNKVFELLDTLLPRWKASPKLYPYNRKEARVPQTIIPAEIRQDKVALACFYFYACIYMRGGIESLQAFSAMLRMRKMDPSLFDPFHAQWYPKEDLQKILRTFVGWDSEAAAHNWIENSRRLVKHWKGNPLNLLQGVRNYEEACRRIRNKRTKRDLDVAGHRGEGFVGFQFKMVSMLLYFLDWERLLPTRFLYPSPTDFHNFRLGIASGSITVAAEEGETVKANERISAPWRTAIMAYLKKRGADPVEVADALWLYSLAMCGFSPATQTKAEGFLDTKFTKGGRKLRTFFSDADLEEHWQPTQWAKRQKNKLAKTCFVCPFLKTCRPVPSRPYYTKGLLVVREPLNLEIMLGSEHLEGSRDVQNHPVHPNLFENPVATP